MFKKGPYGESAPPSAGSPFSSNLAGLEAPKIVFEYGEAKTPEDRQKAHDLAKKVYERANMAQTNTTKEALGQENPFKKWAMSPSTKILTVSVNGEIVGTVSIVHDSDIGLPMDEKYKGALQTYRAQDKKLAEISQLAIDSELVRNLSVKKNVDANGRPMEHLLKEMLTYALRESIDYLCVVCSPEHAELYKNLGFKQIDNAKHDDRVNKTAVPLIRYLKTQGEDVMETFSKVFRLS